MELQRGLLTSAEGSMHVVEARLLLEGGKSISAETVWFTAMMPFITCSTAYMTSCGKMLQENGQVSVGEFNH